MNYPLGHNPIGDHAPGLPRHDGGLPGHKSSQHVHIPLGGSGPTQSSGVPTGHSAQSVQTRGSQNVSSDAFNAFETKFGIWSGRVFIFCAIGLTLPIQVGLYPIAGSIGIAAAAFVYSALHGPLGAGASLEYTWPACFWALLPAMRLEIRAEDRFPTYRLARKWFRPLTVAAAIFYPLRYLEHDSLQTAAQAAVMVAVLMFFIVRLEWASALWHQLQEWLWLRKA